MFITREVSISPVSSFSERHFRVHLYKRENIVPCVKIKYILTREKYFPRHCTLARENFRRRTFTRRVQQNVIATLATERALPGGHIFFFLFARATTTRTTPATATTTLTSRGRKSGCKWRKNFSTCICTGTRLCTPERGGGGDMNKGVVTVWRCAGIWQLELHSAIERERDRAR